MPNNGSEMNAGIFMTGDRGKRRFVRNDTYGSAYASAVDDIKRDMSSAALQLLQDPYSHIGQKMNQLDTVERRAAYKYLTDSLHK